MKTRTGLILSIVSFLGLASLYLVYDNKGYEYGLGSNFCNRKLPYHLSPKFYTEYPQRFYLNDEDDFELAGVGFRYETTNFKIKNFLAYGYNDASVILKCTDSLNNIKYLITYETGYKSKNGNSEVSFKDLSNSDFAKVKEKFQWFEVDKERCYAIDRNKFFSMIGSLLSLFFIIRLFIKLRSSNKKKKKPNDYVDTKFRSADTSL